MKKARFLGNDWETIKLDTVIKEPIMENVEMLSNHFNRYGKAIHYLDITDNDVVADASCGEGYGSFILSLKAGQVIGLDVNKEYIKTAEKYFGSEKIYFYGYGEFNTLVDKIVCIETFEHVPINEMAEFVTKLLTILRTGGSMFMTVPLGNNKPSSYNKFHLNEPSITVLHAIFDGFFKKKDYIIDKYTDSEGYEVEYCMLVLKERL